jgi:predicted nucleic acid-binding protein
MIVLFDTTVLIAGLVQSHPHHAVARPWLDAARTKRLDAFVGSHSLAEFYRVMTTIKSAPPLNPQLVWQMIEYDILPWCTPVALSWADYRNCLQRLVSANESGGIVFDALIVQAALNAGVDKLVSINARHFERLWPNHTNQIINPLITQAP